jgi:hypothetical protein
VHLLVHQALSPSDLKQYGEEGTRLELFLAGVAENAEKFAAAIAIKVPGDGS